MAASPVDSPDTVVSTVILLSVGFVSLLVLAAYEVVVTVTIALHNSAITIECYNMRYSLRIDARLSYCLTTTVLRL
jgi:hypothetical protein